MTRRAMTGQLVLLALVAILSMTGFNNRTVGMWGTKNTGLATADALLDVPSYVSHSFTENDYVQPRYFRRTGAAVVFQADDGYADFWTCFVESSDVIFAETGYRIRGSCAVITTEVGSAPFASWAQIRSRDQVDFEIMLHQDAPSGGGWNSSFSPTKPGFSRTQIDSLLTDIQGRFVQNGVTPPPRGMTYGGHQHTYGDEEILAEHGLYYASASGLPPAADTTSSYSAVAENRSPMEVNCDPWPAAAAGRNQSYLQSGMQRQGGIQNRYQVGRDMIADGKNVSEMKEAVDLAVQHGAILIWGYHDFETAAEGGFPADSLGVIMRYCAAYMAEGKLESLTMEQAVARGAGYVWGELLPHDNFTRLDDIAPDGTSALTGSDFVPLYWPLKQCSEFYLTTGDTLTAVTSNGDQWKVWEHSGTDTVDAIFAQYLSSDSTSYGNSEKPSAGGHVMLGSLIAAETYQTAALPVMIQATGVQSRYIDVTVTVMYANDDDAEGFVGARLFQYAENFADFVNTGYQTYDWTTWAGNSGAPVVTGLDFEETRMVPLFSHGFEDTVWAAAEYDRSLYYQDSNHGRWRRFSRGMLRPMILDGHGTVDTEGWFGNFEDVTTAGGASESWFANLYLFNYDQSGGKTGEKPYANVKWIPYVFRVEILPGMTDWVCGMVKCHRHSNGTIPNFAGTGDFLIADISAHAPRG